MTDREEAIKQLKKLKSFHNGSYGEAINFAIESIKVDMAYDLAYEKAESESNMTNNEAIETLKVAKSEIEWEYPMDYQIALDKAIEALEQEPSDCISRADAIKALEYSLSIEADGGLDKYKTVIKDLLDAIYDMQKKAIEDLPSIQPKTEVREKGHWVEDIINGKALYSCSECLHTVSNYEGCFHYCPRCGKELKGVIRNDM